VPAVTGLPTEVDEDELAAARAAGHRRDLVQLLVGRVILPGRPYLALAEAATAAGIDRALALRFWLALGFADPGDEPIFSDYDVAAFRFATDGVAAEAYARVIEQSRVLASAMATVAEVWTDDLVDVAMDLAGAGTDGMTIADRLVADLDLERLAGALDYVFRRQLFAALQRRIAYEDPTEHQPMIVGFADLTGFTRLSQNVSDDELADLVRRFEAVTRDAIAAGGGRAIKSIGDEVLFTVPEATEGVELALDLVHAVADDDVLPPMRIGLAWGEVIRQDGDVYGPTVNRASRLVDLARAGAVIVDANVRDALDDDADRFRIRPLGRRRLKDIGAVRIYAVGAR
jgi:adenylate cyclase